MARSTRTVRVAPAQKSAAKALVSRSPKTGRFVSSSVTKVANARPSDSGVGRVSEKATDAPAR